MDDVLIGILSILCFFVVLNTTEDSRMTTLKSNYYSFVDELPENYKKIKNHSIITGTYNGDVGSNVNKGSEIYMCIDGVPNDQFHILLHELSHTMVKEYDHSGNFWEEYKKLKKIAVDKGYYKPTDTKPYCGKTISESS